MTALWYPFSQVDAEPTQQFVRGDGNYLYDAQGRAYLNAASGLWNLSLGLNHPQLQQRMTAQLQQLAYGTLFDAGHPPAVRLAERLVALSDGRMSKVYLSTSGSAAVEVAIRLARLYQRCQGATKKTGVISFDKSYHGGALLNLSASGLERQKLQQWEQPLAGFMQIPSPDQAVESLAMLKHLLAEQSDNIACLLFEPILGSAGVIIPEPAYVDAVQQLCRQHQVLLIADEVASGAGRCGAMFASTLLGWQPDFIALSKSLNAGYAALGATLISPQVVSAVKRAQAPLLYGSTQDGNPVACVAALATLDCLQQQQLFDRAGELGARLLTALQPLTGHTVLQQVRGKGLMIGLELAHLDATRTPFSPAEAYETRMLCQQQGLLLYHFASGLSLFPPLLLSDDDVEDMLDMLSTVLRGLR